MGNNRWLCPRDTAELRDVDATNAGFELKRGGRWWIRFRCAGPSGRDPVHYVVVTKRGIGVEAAVPAKSHKDYSGELSPAPAPPAPPRRTVIVRRLR